MVALLRSSIASCAREVGRRYAASRMRDQATFGRRDLPPRSFRLAMFGHAGAVGIELLVAPEVLRITRRPNAARVQGLRALRADPDAAVLRLRIARRCGRADGNNDSEHGQTFLKVNHDESPSSSRPGLRNI